MLIWRTMDSCILMRNRRNKMLTLRISIITLKVRFCVSLCFAFSNLCCDFWILTQIVFSFFKVWLRLNLKVLFLGLLRLLRWNQTRLSGKIPEVFFFLCEFGRIIVDLEGTRFVFVWALNITMMGRDRDALFDWYSSYVI